MNRMRTVGIFVGGLLVGISLTLGLGASGQAANNSKNQMPPYEIVTYINGSAMIYDPATQQLFVYDGNLVNCTAIRKIGVLGQPLQRVLN